MYPSLGDGVNVAAGFVVNTTRELKPGESHSGHSDTAHLGPAQLAIRIPYCTVEGIRRCTATKA